jgi:predicted negative regulator of RcsB-dependent stress response
MLSYIVTNIIISIVIIIIFHFLWNYIQNTYLTKYTKTKDLVHSQTQKYKKMIEELQNQNQKIMNTEPNEPIPSFSMEEDLEKFMKENL